MTEGEKKWEREEEKCHEEDLFSPSPFSISGDIPRATPEGDKKGERGGKKREKKKGGGGKGNNTEMLLL